MDDWISQLYTHTTILNSKYLKATNFAGGSLTYTVYPWSPRHSQNGRSGFAPWNLLHGHNLPSHKWTATCPAVFNQTTVEKWWNNRTNKARCWTPGEGDGEKIVIKHAKGKLCQCPVISDISQLAMFHYQRVACYGIAWNQSIMISQWCSHHVMSPLYSHLFFLKKHEILWPFQGPRGTYHMVYARAVGDMLNMVRYLQLWMLNFSFPSAPMIFP